jgi:hypothetical protein
MVWLPPTVAEALGLIAATIGVDVERMATRTRIAAVERALDQPAGDANAPPEKQIASQIAALIDDLLRSLRDLVEPDAARAVESILHATLERSGIGWTFDRLSTVMTIQAWRRKSGEPRALADWAEGHIEISEGHLERPEDWASGLTDHPDELRELPWVTTDPAAGALPTIYLGGPFVALDPNCHLHIDLVCRQVAIAIDYGLSRQPKPAPVRLIHPSGDVISDYKDRDDDRDRHWLVTCRADIVGRADAYILSDIARRPPGFGGAIELLLHDAAYGPTLILIDEEGLYHSRFELGLVPDIDATVLQYRDPADMAAKLASWTFDNFDDIMAAHRRRLNDHLLYAPHLAELHELVANASNATLRAALHRSGLTGPYLRLLLDGTGADLFSATPWHKRERLLATLRANRRHLERPTRTNRSIDRRIDLGALRIAQAKKGWSEDHRLELGRAAVRQLARAGADSRLHLLTPEAWILFDERFRRTR